MSLPTGLQRPLQRTSHRHLAACELGRRPQTTGRAVGGKFFDVGSGGDQAFQVNHRIQRWATQVEAAYRQPYCLAVAREVNPPLSREDRGVHGGEALSVPGARR